jgi:hypothetical protein
MLVQYVPVTLTRPHLQSIWLLTLSDVEWGGVFDIVPTTTNTCSAVTTGRPIRGTVARAVSEEEKALYHGTNEPVDTERRIASVAFATTDYTRATECAPGRPINVFFHVHPVMVVRDRQTHVARIAPPSIGDIFVHCILSNLLNYQATGNLNCAMVMAFEGLYVYTITPSKFRHLWAEYQHRTKKGDVWADIVADFQKRTFAELRPANKAFMKDRDAFCDRFHDQFDTRAAPLLHDTLWHTGLGHPALMFPYARAIKTSLVRDYARDNILTRALVDLGYIYDFYPAPFDQDLVFHAPSVVRSHPT